ncbi:tetraspanin-6-like [Stylophora pistillata]|nr:tetraspanin-6-like [Stylophora pistillata]XP_022797845.1 tetraspanin-6-like [Stylophora pistillata]
MALWESPGDERARFYTTKVLPGMGGCMIILGLIMFLTGVIVLALETHHSAVTTVKFEIPFTLYLVAGLLAAQAGIVILWVTTRANGSPPDVKKWSPMFIGILCVAIVFTLSAVILSFTRKLNDIENDMTNTIQEYGLFGKGEETSFIDTLQTKDHCCGVNYYTDWRNTKYGARRVYVVPDSCCKTNEYACGYQFKLDNINRRGCLEVIKRSVRTHLGIVKIMGIIFLLVKVGKVIAIVVIRKKYLSG